MKFQQWFCISVSCVLFILTPLNTFSQLRWINVDSLFQPLPASFHVFKTTDSLDGKPNVAYYAEADLSDRNLIFTADTTFERRLTPARFYEKNAGPLLVVNCTFFSFATHKNLNIVMKEGKILAHNIHSITGRGKDTFTYRHHLGSALGINKNRRPAVTWVYTDSALKHPISFSQPVNYRDSSIHGQLTKFISRVKSRGDKVDYSNTTIARWKMRTAVGGGPVLVMNSEVNITNDEENKFAGKAKNDRHPRTGMGYTSDRKIIILVIAGRYPGVAEGATLIQEAKIFKDLGCTSALNLDGGGSSCMLINGKPTIPVADVAGQRAVPAVFIIANK